LEPELQPELQEPEPHQNFYPELEPEPEPHKNDVAPQHDFFSLRILPQGGRTIRNIKQFF
jgi:hypothetical protein